MRHWLVVFLVLACGSGVRAAQLEAYPVPAMSEISCGKDPKNPPARLPAPAARTLTLVAPRNGVVNGQILLKATGGGVTTKVTPGGLSGPNGAEIPAAQVTVRYGQYVSYSNTLSVYRWQKDIGLASQAADDKAAGYGIEQGSWRVDCLLPQAACEVEEGLPRCAWLTIATPRDAAPGVYKGALTVEHAAPIPLELEIVNAVVPPLAASPMSNDIRPMWEVIAAGNGIPLQECWKSERFWKVTEGYLEKLGQLRTFTCGIGVLAPSLTSCTGMVEWLKDGEKWSWDYSAMERFIAAYRKCVGEPHWVDATAFVPFENKPAFPIRYTDAATKQPALANLDRTQAETQALVLRFVKDLKLRLAALKLEDKLAIGIWHDKMAPLGDPLRERLLNELPDLKLSLWAHTDGFGKRWPGRVALYESKCPDGTGVGGGYPIKACMRRALEHPDRFFPFAWDVFERGMVGLGNVDFANWSGDRRAAEYSYYIGGNPFYSWQRQLVYPMQQDQVVTGILYELFREASQDYELLKLLKGKGASGGVIAALRQRLDEFSEVHKEGRLFMKLGADPAGVEKLHWDILREAGKAGVGQ